MSTGMFHFFTKFHHFNFSFSLKSRTSLAEIFLRMNKSMSLSLSGPPSLLSFPIPAAGPGKWNPLLAQICRKAMPSAQSVPLLQAILFNQQ
jgi:hypothetical protein